MTDSSIFLLGFMGAGKSTIGIILAKKLALPFYDLDHEIESHTGDDIPTIFARDGEPVFRVLEHTVLGHLPAPAVVALGGGAFMTPSVRELAAQRGRSLFLQWPFQVLYQRVAGDSNRPLAADPEGLEQLYRKREPIYLQADLVWKSQQVETETPEIVALQLQEMIQATQSL